MAKNVFIFAYTRCNLGDDLFVKLLCNRYPKVKFYISCSREDKTAFLNISNLKVILGLPISQKAPNLFRINSKIRSVLCRFRMLFCGAVVNIGGSIFIQQSNKKEVSKEYKNKIIHKKPYFIIGSNFGPYKDEHYYTSYKSLFKFAKDICFRDTYSYNLFSDLPNVRYGADVIFSYKTAKNVEETNNIVISVIDLSKRQDLKRYKENYISKIIELSLFFVKKGYGVSLMSFCESEGDKAAIEEILSRINIEDKKNISPYYYSGDVDGALNLIAKSKYVLATRFHAMILGFVFNKPVFPIMYSDKSLNVIEDMGFDGEYTDVENIDKIDPNKVFNYLSQRSPFDISEQIASSFSQFKGLDTFLHNELGGKNK
jgi:colanic acid/amylovoran biosynthesis protein